MACKKRVPPCSQILRTKRGAEAVIVLTESVWILWIWKTGVLANHGSGWDMLRLMLYSVLFCYFQSRFLHIVNTFLTIWAKDLV